MVDNLKFIHYYHILLNKGESHKRICGIISLAISENLKHRKQWNQYEKTCNAYNLDFTLGTDTAASEYYIGPRVFLYVLRFLGLHGNNSCLLYENKQNVTLNLQNFTMSVKSL